MKAGLTISQSRFKAKPKSMLPNQEVGSCRLVEEELNRLEATIKWSMEKNWNQTNENAF